MVSPFWTCSVGPGNWPFTVKMFFVPHSLVYGVSFTYSPKFTHIDAIHDVENQTIAFQEMNSEIFSY